VTKNRNIDEEKTAFNSKWEEAHFCAELGGKPQCLISLQVIGGSKDYNVNRHYNTLHKEKMANMKEPQDLQCCVI
jgi:hypothetical protein